MFAATKVDGVNAVEVTVPSTQDRFELVYSGYRRNGETGPMTYLFGVSTVHDIYIKKPARGTKEDPYSWLKMAIAAALDPTGNIPIQEIKFRTETPPAFAEAAAARAAKPLAKRASGPLAAYFQS